MYIQQLGQLQFKKLCDLTTEERMIKFHVQVRLHRTILSFQVPDVVTNRPAQAVRLDHQGVRD